VLRGAAALAVRGALAPIDGRMFRTTTGFAEPKGVADEPAAVGA
jgi:hypothetical protein